METTTTDWLGLQGKVAVVTGAGGGIGREVALELARVGVDVLVIDLNEEGAKETSALITAETKARSVHYACDITDVEKIAEAGRLLRAELGPADILVNNAGIAGHTPLMSTTLDDWRRVIDVNVTGFLICTQEFASDMLERGEGSVVHISSICGSNTVPGLGGYSSSKAAVTMMSKQLAVEWGGSGVRSNTVGPGLTRTPLTEASYVDDESRRAREGTVPMKRIGTPRDIADAVTWLASPRSSYVTAQNILVDGGLDQALMQNVRSISVSAIGS